MRIKPVGIRPDQVFEDCGGFRVLPCLIIELRDLKPGERIIRMKLQCKFQQRPSALDVVRL